MEKYRINKLLFIIKNELNEISWEAIFLRKAIFRGAIFWRGDFPEGQFFRGQFSGGIFPGWIFPRDIIPRTVFKEGDSSNRQKIEVGSQTFLF